MVTIYDYEVSELSSLLFQMVDKDAYEEDAIGGYELTDQLSEKINKFLKYRGVEVVIVD